MSIPEEDELREFGRLIYEGVTGSPFGSLPKSELELLLFSSMITSGLIDVEAASNFSLARQLKCSPTKASSMVFNHRLRGASEDADDTSLQLAAATKVVINRKGSRDGEVTLNVEDRFWRSELIERLKKAGVYTDTSFNRERVILDEESFYAACPDVFGAAGKDISEEAKKKAGKKKQFLADLMKGLSTGAAKKVGGIAAEQIVGGMSILQIANALAAVTA